MQGRQQLPPNFTPSAERREGRTALAERAGLLPSTETQRIASNFVVAPPSVYCQRAFNPIVLFLHHRGNELGGGRGQEGPGLILDGVTDVTITKSVSPHVLYHTSVYNLVQLR